MNKFCLWLILAMLFTACTQNHGLPEPGSASYRELCTAFYTGLAGLQSGEDVRAKEDLTRASQLAPDEPAAWANLSVFQLRRQEYDAALQSAETARKLAPTNSQIEALLGQIQGKRGETAECVTHFKKSIALDSGNLKAIYALASELEREGNDGEAERSLKQVLKARPANTGVLLEAARLAAKSGDSAGLKGTLEGLKNQSEGWPDVAQKQLAALQQAAAGPSIRAAAVQVQFLRNVLLRVPAYQRSLDEVRTPTTVVFEPFLKFLRLPSPTSMPAAADTQLRFDSVALASVPKTNLTWLGAFALNGEDNPAIIWADQNVVQVGTARLPLPSMASGPLPVHAIAGADLNYDFKTDLIVATMGGIRIYRQVDPQHFADVTAETKLDASILHGDYTGAWAFDVDLDGDLDIVLGVINGDPPVLRNNGDGTFTVIRPFTQMNGLTAFAAADVDGDGDPDVAMLDKNGQLVIFSNERLGAYKLRELPKDGNVRVRALAAADIDGDGLPDFIYMRDDLSIARLSSSADGIAWKEVELVHAAQSASMTGQVELEVADLDNNGALDLVLGDQAFLSDGKAFNSKKVRFAGSVRAVADFNNDGRLDLMSIGGSSALQLVNHGSKNYNWQTIRTKASQATGDQRINSFGIGGEIEVRSDLLTQKQVITSPILHFGLGEHSAVDFARIIWPNGFVQAEFALKADQSVLALQRLKGSCPFLFAWDGKQIRFVKDTAPWSPALGLHINAQKVAGIYQTQEWFKIPGEALQPRDGFYEVRITAEYWETFYIDHYSLMVIDHPAGTQVYSDERFAIPPPPLRIYATQDAKPFAGAKDDNGNDVTRTVAALDSNYLDNFGRGQYQGVTRDHWVELELPKDAPTDKPLYLIAHGWLHPSDGTTNIAMGQDKNIQPQGLSIEVPSKKGGWIKAKENLGFPAGRLKTIVLDLSGIFQPGVDRKLRLRTNMEIYWDQLEWASGLQNGSAKTKHLELTDASLAYRGFSDMRQANISSPELPTYNKLVANGQRWRDMQGYFTRYGDVKELLAKIDDRMVIANAGDELRLRFSAEPLPPAGWLRDYVIVGDGWIKDGDYNSVFSKTVLPLPYHGMKDYTQVPSTLEDDAAYKLHPSDWQTFHTRYVTPASFVTALWEH